MTRRANQIERARAQCGARAALSGGSVLALSMLCSACAVGPDFVAPPPPEVEQYTPGKTASPGNGQRFVEGSDVPERWWTAFRSESLDQVIDEAIERNPTLQAAEAAIQAAGYTTDAAIGGFFPQVVLGSNSSYNYTSGNSTTSTVTQSAFSFFTKSVQINYTLDVWGANWRRVEGLEAQHQAQIYQKQAAYNLLAARVAQAAIEEASVRGQIVATRRVITLGEARLGLLERELAYGKIPGNEVLAERAALAQTRQSLPALERRLAQQRNLLTALAGRYPSAEVEEIFALSHFSLPRDLPLSLPSQLVAQRPDIKGAEANLHSASAQIGVAVAARLPQITLSGNASTSAFALAQLFHPGTYAYLLAGNVAQTAFDGMTLYNNQKAAEASFRQAEAQYRDVAIKAFQEVADTLRALQTDARAVASSREAEAMSRRYFVTVRTRRRLGDASELVVIDAERSYLAAAVARIEAEAQRLSDTVALFVALGGGWRKEERG